MMGVGHKIEVLDLGYVMLVEPFGTGLDGVPLGDEATEDNPGVDDWDYEVGIIEAARQSTQGTFRGWERLDCDCGYDPVDGKHSPRCASTIVPGDKHLLKRLHVLNHATPFEFAGMIIEVQAPIMVLREWHRHRTQAYSEASARYAPLPAHDYMPSVERLMMKSDGNKQAGALKGAAELDESTAQVVQFQLHESYMKAELNYQQALQAGVPKELARLFLPMGRYSKMRAIASLRNWLGFLRLRLDPAAQWEIRQYAQAVDQIIEHTFPQTHRLFHGG